MQIVLKFDLYLSDRGYFVMDQTPDSYTELHRATPSYNEISVVSPGERETPRT